MSHKLEIIDENDKVIGIEERDVAHERGLLHREVHVWFYTPKGEIVFQKRALDKDTFPGLLDATVGGHVEIGDSYTGTAIKETQEETGIKLKEDDFEFLRMMRRRHEDRATDKVNDCIGAVYVYKFEGDLKDLQVEKGAATGFETWSVDKVLSLTDEEKEKFIIYLVTGEMLEIFEEIKRKIV